MARSAQRVETAARDESQFAMSSPRCAGDCQGARRRRRRRGVGACRRRRGNDQGGRGGRDHGGREDSSQRRRRHMSANAGPGWPVPRPPAASADEPPGANRRNGRAEAPRDFHPERRLMCAPRNRLVLQGKTADRRIPRSARTKFALYYWAERAHYYPRRRGVLCDTQRTADCIGFPVRSNTGPSCLP